MYLKDTHCTRAFWLIFYVGLCEWVRVCEYYIFVVLRTVSKKNRISRGTRGYPGNKARWRESASTVVWGSACGSRPLHASPPGVPAARCNKLSIRALSICVTHCVYARTRWTGTPRFPIQIQLLNNDWIEARTQHRRAHTHNYVACSLYIPHREMCAVSNVYQVCHL